MYVPPFDHENVWTGNQTTFEEIAKQMADQGNGRADVMACFVGGGGLLIGMLQGMAEAGWWNTQLLAVETKGAETLSESMKNGELIALPGISSEATALGAMKVADRAFELAQMHEAASRARYVVLSDSEAAMGCWRFADDDRSLVELACGVDLALCHGGRLDTALGRNVKPDDKVVIIVCGARMLRPPWSRVRGRSMAILTTVHKRSAYCKDRDTPGHANPWRGHESRRRNGGFHADPHMRFCYPPSESGANDRDMTTKQHQRQVKRSF